VSTKHVLMRFDEQYAFILTVVGFDNAAGVLSKHLCLWRR